MFLKCFNKKLMLIILGCSQLFAGSVHVNQLGYYPTGTKIAIAVGATGTTFSLLSASTGDVVFTKDLGASATWTASNETTRVADFSEFTTAGEYKIRIAGCEDSYAFKIGANVCLDLAKASIKALYYNRASMELESQYAGKWARPAGHPDNAVNIHSSAVSSTRPSGSKISSPGGWYDAGDYGKYIVNSGISTYTVFAAYQAFPLFYDTLKLNIPESSNSIPDILDEGLYNLKWMLTMQDPDDGGVYHKLTTANFCGFVMPDEDVAPRYVVMKTTTAALDFAAVTAQASRIFRKFESQMPGFAETCLNASLKAWKWARANNSVLYNQTNLNKTYTPKIQTGEYGDNDPSDEFNWAATELYLTTRADSFFTAAYPSGKLDTAYDLPGWSYVYTLGLYSLFLSKDSLTSAVNQNSVISRLGNFASTFNSTYQSSAYKTTMKKGDFCWGSNSVGANQGMALILGYLAGNQSYKDAALGILDYLLGKNPTNYSFVTGLGDKTPMNIHHRPSGADDVLEPVPGFLVGGANPGQEDISGCISDCLQYPSKLAALSYIDDQNSYASNEIAINWNAPLIFLSGAIEAIQSGALKVSRNIRYKNNSLSIPLKLFNDRIELQIPSGWDKGYVTISDLYGRQLEKVNFESSGKLSLNNSFPAQMVILKITANNRTVGENTYTQKILTK